MTRSVTTRPALAGDKPRIRRLYEEALRHHIEIIWGWDDDWQQTYFDKAFLSLSTRVIEVDGCFAGYLQVDHGSDEDYLSMLVLDPGFRSGGVGARLLPRAGARVAASTCAFSGLTRRRGVSMSGKGGCWSGMKGIFWSCGLVSAYRSPERTLHAMNDSPFQSGWHAPVRYRVRPLLATSDLDRAHQGRGGAQHALGLMYRYHVVGVPGDPVIAYMLWNLAAAGGNNNAVSQRASIAKTMTQEQIEEAQALSRTWKVETPLPAQSRTGGG
jgi:GNAT superfamily N-acetyltransferase